MFFKDVACLRSFSKCNNSSTIARNSWFALWILLIFVAMAPAAVSKVIEDTVMDKGSMVLTPSQRPDDSPTQNSGSVIICITNLREVWKVRDTFLDE